MTALALTPIERRAHRAAAHHLQPVVAVGSDGLTPAVVREADAALNAHGLIKVRVFADARETRETILAELADRLQAAPVQHIGKLLVLWRPIPEKEKVEREGRQAGPRMVTLVQPSRSGNHRPTIQKVKLLGNQRVTAAGRVKRKEARQISPKKRAED
jgi:putative YhbY family RNA-binding protein